ncbi:hypothetical protein [Pseudomonas palleroniana]
MDVDAQVIPNCSIEGVRVSELGRCDEARLQRLFERAPADFIALKITCLNLP